MILGRRGEVMTRENDKSVENLLVALESAHEQNRRESVVNEYHQGFYNAVEFLAAAYACREPIFVAIPGEEKKDAESE